MKLKEDLNKIITSKTKFDNEHNNIGMGFFKYLFCAKKQ